MHYFNTNITNVRFKKTTKEDAKIILELIKELATYEKMIEDVAATEERLIESILLTIRSNVLEGILSI